MIQYNVHGSNHLITLKNDGAKMKFQIIFGISTTIIGLFIQQTSQALSKLQNEPVNARVALPVVFNMSKMTRSAKKASRSASIQTCA